MKKTKQPSPINGITEGVIRKQLLAFFFPILLGSLFQQLYNTADAMIVGKFVGKEALAAVTGSPATLINGGYPRLSPWLSGREGIKGHNHNLCREGNLHNHEGGL